jgi:uncharacterized protein (DUF1501 family)
MNRRTFLKTGGLALSAFAFNVQSGGKPTHTKALVVMFQRGAVDGLNAIVPHGERAYYAARPSIAIARNELVDLDGFFGAHPSLQSLIPFWKDRSLAIVHGAGNPEASRSHFDAQDSMEAGTRSSRDGFLTRALRGDRPLEAISMTQSLPRILSGSSALATTDIDRFANSRSASLLESMYPQAYESIRILKTVKPSSGVYPRGPLAGALRQVAQLIKSDVGLSIAFTEVGGWDTHAGQGGAEGQFANRLRDFSDAIAAFAKDLGSRMSDVVVVTMSEFGRTVRENGNRGTDHGHGTVMLLLGGGIRGGRVHGEWPGLEAEQLFERRDLAVTTDYRDVFSEVLTKHIGVTPVEKVFPKYTAKKIGVL